MILFLFKSQLSRKLLYITYTVSLIGIYLTLHYVRIWCEFIFCGGLAQVKIHARQGQKYWPCWHSPNWAPQTLSDKLNPAKQAKAWDDSPLRLWDHQSQPPSTNARWLQSSLTC